MTEKEKIKQFIEDKGVNPSQFYKKTGLSNGFLDSGKSIGADKIKIIISHYPDLNLYWLIADEGEMYTKNVHQKVHQDVHPSLKNESDPELQLILSKQMCQIHLKRIEELSADNAILKKENAELKAKNAQLKGENTSSNKQSRSAS